MCIRDRKIFNLLHEVKIGCLRTLQSFSDDECQVAELANRLEQKWFISNALQEYGRYKLNPFELIDFTDILSNNLHEVYTQCMVSALAFLRDVDVKSLSSIVLARIYGLFSLQNFIWHSITQNTKINGYQDFETFISKYDHVKEVEGRFLKYLRTAALVQIVFGDYESELKKKLGSNDFLSDSEELEYLSSVNQLPSLAQLVNESKLFLKKKLDIYLSNKERITRTANIFLSKDLWTCDFITLPETYSDFLKNYAGKPCEICRSVDANSLMAVCLICGKCFCAVVCSNNKNKPIRNLTEHTGNRHGNCTVLVTIPKGSTVMIDKMFTYDYLSLYTDSLGRVAGEDFRFQLTINVELSRYKLNHENLSKVREVYLRSNIPNTAP
eukprot:TRINITY_DN7204_c0_g1_i1.p1 TRINITY_DN7204_c0_g1~~TRINITY_DN7204_c0_g1_i1.p1  ORF type:complete len:383 (-),score=55.57 TRINITY_DN7204_c0_g1_i1:146-1294(-)